MNARVKSREGFSDVIIFPSNSRLGPSPLFPLLPLLARSVSRAAPPSIYAPPCSGWRSSHSTARPLTIVSHPCIPTPKRAGGWHVAHYVICPLDQSTGGAHFFPAWAKKNAARRRNGWERDGARKSGAGGGSGEGRGERCRGRAKEDTDTPAVAAAVRGGVEKERAVRHYPRSPVADQSPYVKRHFLWVPLGRPVCVIKIDLSPLLFFFAAPSTGPRPPTTRTPLHRVRGQRTETRGPGREMEESRCRNGYEREGGWEREREREGEASYEARASPSE